MRIFQPDSPLMEALARMADLVILNIVTMLCCLPVVTAGAALAGMHYVLLKMARDEEGYIVRSFFKSFRENLRQGIALWLIFLAFAGIFLLDMRLTGAGAAAAGLPFVFRCLLVAFAAYAYAVFLYAFPLLARFRNTVRGTLRNAAILAALALPRTVAMAVVSIVPVAAIWMFPPVIPVFFFIGFSGPGYLCAFLYSPVFKKIEEKDVGEA